MYKIIGADQVEYGPATAGQLRQWIAEGRIIAQTPAQAAGETVWKPISTFTEFAACFPPPPVPATPPALGADGQARALAEVGGPATGLIIVAALGIACASMAFVTNSIGFTFDGFNRMHTLYFPHHNGGMLRHYQMLCGGAKAFFALLKMAASVFILYGGLKMKVLEKHGLCAAAAIVALLPCFSPCCCVGLPIGIWALVVLNKPEVRGQFK